MKLRRTLIEVPDGSGDCFVCIPEEVMERMNWVIGDSVDIQLLPDGALSISTSAGNEVEIDAEILSRALETFGTAEQAERWLKKHHLLLKMSPAEYLSAGGSKQDILKILNAIAYGGTA